MYDNKEREIYRKIRGGRGRVGAMRSACSNYNNYGLIRISYNYGPLILTPKTDTILQL
jgi:hypothetical protein